MAFTEQQSEAIAARGKVLVSASAGAGKTTVMIKRLADILSEGASLDNVLAVTFTNKAAAQMKEKLRSELVSRLSDEDEAKRENIRVQLGKINSADISTIHAFCARLVRTYFYALDGVDASFELAANDAEVGEMRTRAMDNLFDKLYGKGDGKADEDFLYLVDRLKKRRSDSSVREVILQAYDRLRIEPGYKNITAKTARTFSDGGFEEVCRRLGELIGERCAYYSEKVKKFGSTLAFASNGAAYAAVLGEMCESLDYVAEKKDLFDRPLRLNSTSKPRVRAENAAEDERFAKFFNNLKRLYTNLFKDVKSPEEERVAFNESGRLAAAFANVLLLFDEEYTAIKRDEGKLDYGDLEHLAYSLVCAEGSVDNDVKEQINGKYKFVFVDEYQDVNPIQDAIINAV
ncbi:MAG: UvrD-helicase domain-containing protein, partial [Clostridiales bacterium]|nr:UvrD-helicase domain-containing protein [Clostridiales bacterium]